MLYILGFGFFGGIDWTNGEARGELPEVGVLIFFLLVPRVFVARAKDVVEHVHIAR